MSQPKIVGKINGSKNGNGKGHWQVDADLLGEFHAATSVETPMKEGAFDLSDEEKMHRIASHFESIMDILGLDLEDDSLRGTPKRVAKMFVKEIFYGLDPKNKPAVSLFENKFGYRQMLIEKRSECNLFANITSCLSTDLPQWLTSPTGK
jgi:GTP cyclohydrolase I